jgi:hypothetical protein
MANQTKAHQLTLVAQSRLRHQSHPGEGRDPDTNEAQPRLRQQSHPGVHAGFSTRDFRSSPLVKGRDPDANETAQSRLREQNTEQKTQSKVGA